MAPEIPFRFDIPVEVFFKAGKEAGKARRIAGVVSTEHKDKQNEVVLQRGLDFSDFQQNGWFNDNHSRDTTGIVGYPLKVEQATKGGKPATRVEGYLLEGHPPSDKIWELANALQKTDRKLGFSIEGKVLKRSGPDGKIISQARVSNVAITNAPVNTSTGLDVLAKSMMALEQEDQQGIEKALSAGTAVAAPPVAPGEGFPLRTESLEPRVKVTTYGGKKKKKKKKKRLNKAEAFELIRRRHPGLGDRVADRIWNFAKCKGA
jgi:hypothetical protein